MLDIIPFDLYILLITTNRFMSKPDWIKDAEEKKTLSDKEHNLQDQNLTKNLDEFNELISRFKKIYDEVVELGLTIHISPFRFILIDSGFFIGFTQLDYPDSPNEGMLFLIGSEDRTLQLQCMEFDSSDYSNYYHEIQNIKFSDITDEKIYEIYKVLSKYEYLGGKQLQAINPEDTLLATYSFYTSKNNIVDSAKNSAQLSNDDVINKGKKNRSWKFMLTLGFFAINGLLMFLDGFISIVDSGYILFLRNFVDFLAYDVHIEWLMHTDFGKIGYRLFAFNITVLAMYLFITRKIDE
jgi:hypothetical protein